MIYPSKTPNSTKEASGYLYHHISDHRHSPLSILRGLAGLLDVPIKSEKEERHLKKRSGLGL